MKKVMWLVMALLLIAPVAFASVGVQIAGVEADAAAVINCSTGTSCAVTNGVLAIQSVATGAVAAITSGTISGVTLSASTIAASGAVTLNDATTLGNAIGDITTFTGKIAGATPMSFDGLTANTVYTILAVDDPASTSKTVTLPSVTGTILLTGAAVALTPSATPALTVVKGSTLYTMTPTDNEDQTITFSGAGSAGDRSTIIFTSTGTGDEVITFHATLVASAGTITVGTTAAREMVINFVSNGSRWFETSRTAELT